MFLFIVNAGFNAPTCLDSNTSHVLIYHSLPSFEYTGNLIQIHLMFLFIDIRNFGLDTERNSNTSHVFIYPSNPVRTCWK